MAGSVQTYARTKNKKKHKNETSSGTKVQIAAKSKKNGKRRVKVEKAIIEET